MSELLLPPAAWIAHVDLDAFFASVEQLDKPSIRGEPVIVGGLGPRGVVATASYEARKFGVHSAMPIRAARALCPVGVFLGPRFARYKLVSRMVFGLMQEITPVVEPLSLDEGFLDLSHSPGPPQDSRSVETLLAGLRERVRSTTGLAASAGAGRSKLIAKMASDAAKPDGVVVVDRGEEEGFLDPMPVRALWGVGPATADRLSRYGVTTVKQLRSLDRHQLVRLLGQSHGNLLYGFARGDDRRSVQPSRERKSIGCERTFAADLHGRHDVHAALLHIAAEAASRLVQHHSAGRTITLKVRYSDFSTTTHSVTTRLATADPDTIRGAVLKLADHVEFWRGVRLLGVSISGLSGAWQGVLPLRFSLPEGTAEPPAPATPAVAVRESFVPGEDVVHPVYGRGWVRSVDRYWITVQFETLDTGVGFSKTFSSDYRGLELYAWPTSFPDPGIA